MVAGAGMRRGWAMAAALLAGAAAAPAPVQLSGAVRHAGPWTAGALAALPQTEITALDAHVKGRTHKYSGPLLLAVLEFAGWADAPGRATHLRHTMRVRGADGYEVALAVGEIDPRMEGKDVILALTEDGATLPAPMLVVPRDHHAGRRVQDVVAIEVD